jgi:hypothetical protein
MKQLTKKHLETLLDSVETMIEAEHSSMGDDGWDNQDFLTSLEELQTIIVKRISDRSRLIL